MTRNFGISRDGRDRSGGTATVPSSYAPVTQRNPEIPSHLARYYDQRNVYPLPAQSLRPDPLAAATRERAALSFVTVVLSLTFLAPLVLAWAMIKFR